MKTYKDNIPQFNTLTPFTGTNGVPYYSFNRFRELGGVIDGFSTKFGGVSTGHLESMNLGTNRGDNPANVRENFHRMAEALKVDENMMVLSHQTHSTNVRVITKADAGNGVVRDNDFCDVDGMITNEPEITLVTSYADCVPLYFYDPVKHVIGLSHSGWRGTVGMIGLKTVKLMEEAYGCNPEDIIAAIGPSICQECYEVSEDVAAEFIREFDINEDAIQSTYDRSSCEDKDILIHRSDDTSKYQLSLWKANEQVFRKAGLKIENIIRSDVCTCHHNDIFFSHRATNGLRGNVCAFLCLKETPN